MVSFFSKGSSLNLKGVEKSIKRALSLTFFIMKKVCLLLFFLFFSYTVYPFWIWSPKTNEWRNSKHSAPVTPYIQQNKALELFEKGEYKKAYREFNRVLKSYPDAKESAEAQYYVAKCLEKLDKFYEAFLEYQKLITSYPNSQRLNEAIERQYSIGELFMDKEHKKILGLSKYDFMDHPAVEIFKKIVDNAPYSDYAPGSQYKMGVILMELGRYDEAGEAFLKVINEYPDSEWTASAKYQSAIAAEKRISGVDYDSSNLGEASTRLEEFIKEYPEAKVSFEAESRLKELRNKEAKKNFDIAQFYDNQGKYKSALNYYKKVVKNYSGSSYYKVSLKRFEELGPLVEGNKNEEE